MVLEVSLPDLVISLSDYNTDPDFRNAISRARELQQESQADFVTLFDQAWKEQNAGKELWRIFHNLDNKEKFPAKITDEQVIEILQEEAKIAINNTENIIKRRIDKFGVAQPVVQKQSFSGRILVELPGVDDRDRVRNNLKATANLEFWETYTNQEIAQYLLLANDAYAKVYYPDAFVEEDTTATATEEIADAAEEVVEDLEAAADTVKQDIEDLLDLESESGDTAEGTDSEEEKTLSDEKRRQR